MDAAPAHRVFQLPGETLAHVCAYVSDTSVAECLVLRLTCSAGVVTNDLAVPVAQHLQLVLPRGGRVTRAKTGDPFAALLGAERRQREAERMQRDRTVWRFWMALHKADGAARLRKALGEDRKLATHRLAFFAERSLLFLAAWRGRVRCVRALLDCGASATEADALGCTPLIVAAWAGRAAVVDVLLRAPGVDGPHLGVAGEPPQSSSCGGRGPKTAADWARRKGLLHVAAAIEAREATYLKQAKAIVRATNRAADTSRRTKAYY